MGSSGRWLAAVMNPSSDMLMSKITLAITCLRRFLASRGQPRVHLAELPRQLASVGTRGPWSRTALGEEVARRLARGVGLCVGGAASSTRDGSAGRRVLRQEDAAVKHPFACESEVGLSDPVEHRFAATRPHQQRK